MKRRLESYINSRQNSLHNKELSGIEALYNKGVNCSRRHHNLKQYELKTNMYELNRAVRYMEEKLIKLKVE